MECLSSAIGQLHVDLNNTKMNSHLLDNIMIEYNGIARMTSQGRQLQLIHQDGDENNEGSLSSSESSKHDSGNGSDAESSKGGNGTAESDRAQKTTLGDQVKGHKDIVEYFN